MKKTIRDIDVAGKRVLHHCDFNIKLRRDEKGNLVPVSDIRLKAYFPSIFYLLEKKAKIVFISYLERPGGKVVEDLRMRPIAKRLSQLINKEVVVLDDCIGPQVSQFINQMKPGEMVMLENTRFYPGEEADDDQFAGQLASNGDLMVEDAFGHCHRVHASTTGIPRHIPSVAGLYLEQEVDIFDQLMVSPQRPFILIIGGTKTSDKMGAFKKLANLADKILIGGAVANNFLKAKGINVGNSFMEEPFVDKANGEKIDPISLAKELITSYPNKIVLPVDLVASDNISNPLQLQLINLSQNQVIPDGWLFLDLGLQTISLYQQIIQSGQMIFWDGPLGKYEDEKFRAGTLKIAQTMAENKGTTVLAGGDTAAAAEQFDLVFKYTHVSIAGGAALEYLAGKKLPGIEALADK